MDIKLKVEELLPVIVEEFIKLELPQDKNHKK